MPEDHKKYKVLFDIAPVGISIVDENRKIIESNKTLNKILRLSKTGMKNAEYTVRKYRNSDGNELSPEEFPSSYALREKKILKDFEIEITDEDGESFWTKVSAAPFFDGGNYALLITRDITDEKNAVKGMQDSEKRLRLLMANSGLGIAFFDVNGNIMMFNQEAARNMNGKISDFIGKNLTEIYGTNGEIYIKRLEMAVSSEIPLQFEDCIMIDGRRSWFLSTMNRIIDENGKIEGIQVISNNITDRKNNETKLRMSQKKLQKLSVKQEEIREKDLLNLAMNLHDDLGQKLSAMNLYIAWLKNRIDPASEEVSRKIDEINQLIHESIEGIKEISSTLRPSFLFELGIIPAIESMLKKFEQQYGIRCESLYNPPELKIDNRISLILYRILQESLTNIARHAKASLVIINLTLFERKIEMSITDNGIGINESEINSLHSFGIVGIKERTKSVGGRVSISGDKTAGTSIKVSIPLRKNKP